jgi:tetratricopeptide (TPR) repeat protein
MGPGMQRPPFPVASRVLQGMLANALGHHQAGRLVEAERIYRRILAIDDHHADSLHLLGMIEYQRGRQDPAVQMIRQAIAIDENQAHYHTNLGTVLQARGDPDEAAACYERALMLQPDLAEAHINLGNILAVQGKLDQAVACHERALALKPECAEGFYNLGSARQSQGKLDDAVACYERALVLKPDYFDAHNNLGIALAGQGRTAEAITHYERAIELNPGHANAHNNLGLALAAQGRTAEAITHYERALELNPGHARVHSNLGLALAAQGRMEDAIAHYERAIELNPDHANVHSNLGIALVVQGRMEDAIAHYEHALALNPDHAAAHNNLGIVLADQDKPDEAMAHYARALAINPDHAEALNNLGNIFKAQGRFDDALAHYGGAIAIRPEYAEAHLNRSEIKFFHRGDADLTALEALAARDGVSANEAMYVHFALAKALEDTGDYLRAFEHLRNGNALKRGQINYDEAAVLTLFQRISTVFDRSLFDRFRGAGEPSSVPVFVLGMPRSGSTLIEQILASHPQIHGAGELEHLEKAIGALSVGDPPVPYPECVPALDGMALRALGQAYLARLPAVAAGKLRIVDKLPGNFLSIGLIRLILPNARIIHTMRHPIDTCVSCYSRLFPSGLYFTNDLAELGRYYSRYRELMAHWRSVLPPSAILDVSYEDVVDDLEGQARRLIDYCGLPWDDRCIAFHRTNRTVKTASAVQIRQPLYRSSLQRWRRYEGGLAPLLLELQNVLP